MTDTIRIIPPKGFDYINTGNPSATTNPPTALVTWLNATTGVIWVCTDNTTDANVWVSHSSIISVGAANLPVGTSKTISFSGTGTFTQALDVISEEGVYEVEVRSVYSAPSTGNYLLLKPNDVDTGTNAFTGKRTLSQGTSMIVGDVSQTNMYVGIGITSISISRLSTFTSHKSIATHFFGYETTLDVFDLQQRWTDTTTAWTSLGTLHFPETSEGTIVVRRLA